MQGCPGDESNADDLDSSACCATCDGNAVEERHAVGRGPARAGCRDSDGNLAVAAPLRPSPKSPSWAATERLLSLLVVLLSDDPNAERDRKRWRVQQQLALTLCRIYSESEHCGRSYCDGDPPERIARVAAAHRSLARPAHTRSGTDRKPAAPTSSGGRDELRLVPSPNCQIFKAEVSDFGPALTSPSDAESLTTRPHLRRPLNRQNGPSVCVRPRVKLTHSRAFPRSPRSPPETALNWLRRSLSSSRMDPPRS